MDACLLKAFGSFRSVARSGDLRSHRHVFTMDRHHGLPFFVAEEEVLCEGSGPRDVAPESIRCSRPSSISKITRSALFQTGSFGALAGFKGLETLNYGHGALM
uniref:Uncharacterized protein n=1 Tax=Panagrellus redivivus TaxID=6233 RepID=A0A7E4VVQ9_PANRE